MLLVDVLPASFDVAHWNRSTSAYAFPKHGDVEQQVFDGPADVPANAELMAYDCVTWWTTTTVERVTVGVDGRERHRCSLPRTPADDQ